MARLSHTRTKKRFLGQVLGAGYPPYLPPWRVEERVLPRRQAQENFQYFMCVWRNRAEYFRLWLDSFFGLRLEPGAASLAALDRWARDYAGLLLANESVARSYFSYERPWFGRGAGCSVLFDLGVTFGAAMIAEHPALLWDMDPITALWPQDAVRLKGRFGSGFQRPKLARFDLPNFGRDPLGEVFAFAMQGGLGAGLAQSRGLIDLRDPPPVAIAPRPALPHSLARAFTALGR